ncbi:MAG: N-acetylmuramoyl-L-alanine amidase [Candidatus Gastranaerophilales bacterium]|nr:N-acetylmuramoyl-L-alanine amidase [Candidatus Gastranaerophilales bacterium]
MRRDCLIKFIILVWCALFSFMTPSFCADLKITNILVDDSSNLIFLNSNQDVRDAEYKVDILQNPKRAYIDIKDTVLSIPKQTLDFETGPISRVIIAQNSTDTVRVVFYTDDDKVIKDIKLFKFQNSLVFRLKDVEFIDNKTPVIYSDILPKEYEQQKIEIPIEKAKYSKYILTNIVDRKSQLLVSGVGTLKLNRPFILINPMRLVYDIPNAIVKDNSFYGDYELENGDKIKVGQFESDILRIVITTSKPDNYKAFVSTDLQSVLFADVLNIDNKDLLDANTPSKLENITVKQPNSNDTMMTLKFNNPTIHSLRRTYNKFIIDLLNVDYETNKNLFDCPKSNQFKGFTVQKLNGSANSTTLTFPVRESLKIDTGMTRDAQTIALKISGTYESPKPVQNKAPALAPKPLDGKVIIVDAGHGGKDAGACAGKCYEKIPALSISQMLAQNLQNQGAKIIMTRDDDTFVTLQDRVAISNYENADFFISIHLNSSEKSHINGIETHWYKPDSKEAAGIIHQAFAEAVPANDRGLFNSCFYVINHTKAPAILVEVGFISNPAEREQLFAQKRQQDTAKALTEGIVKYFKVKDK